jgi:DNA-binding HxlR family transcriptional regulator
MDRNHESGGSATEGDMTATNEHVEAEDHLDVLFGRRWTTKIVMAMLERNEPLRFTDLIRAVPGLSKRLLTERLQDLEAAGLVKRQVDTARPITITYALSENGAALRATFRELRAWVQQQSA